MVSDSLLALTVGPAILIGLVSVGVYHTVEFRTERHERWFVKAGVGLLPVYALLEFKLMPASSLPEGILLVTALCLAYAFRGFHRKVVG